MTGKIFQKKLYFSNIIVFLVFEIQTLYLCYFCKIKCFPFFPHPDISSLCLHYSLTGDNKKN